MTPQGPDLRAPLREIVRAAERCLRRCTRDGECLIFPDGKGHPQLRVRVSYRRYTTMQAARAVWIASGRGYPELGHTVQRTCGVRGCVAIGHLVVCKPGDVVSDVVRDKLRIGNRESGRRRRVWSDEQRHWLLWFVENGFSINESARRVGIRREIAHHIVSGRIEGGRSLSRGTLDNPKCTRCGSLGHFRDRGCPEAHL